MQGIGSGKLGSERKLTEGNYREVTQDKIHSRTNTTVIRRQKSRRERGESKAGDFGPFQSPQIPSAEP